MNYISFGEDGICMFKKLLLIVILVFLSACASIVPDKDSLRVNLSGMQMLESTLMEQRFLVKIRVQNRSQSTLNIRGVSFDLALNDKDFASGVSNQNISIAPLSESVLSVHITSTLFGLIRQFQSMQTVQTDPFRYDISGTVYVSNAAFGLPFSETGEIDLK